MAVIDKDFLSYYAFLGEGVTFFSPTNSYTTNMPP